MLFKLKFITILTAILFLSSCAKEEVDCRTELFGTYSGTRTCSDNTGSNSYTSSTTITISESIQDNKVVVTISGIGFLADVSSDCSSVTIVSQTYNNGSSSGLTTISGNFIINGNSLTGNFSSVDSNYSNNCMLNLTQL